MGTGSPALAEIVASGDLPRASIGPGGNGGDSAIFGEKLLLTFFRHLEPGINPAVEIGRVLTDEMHFKHSPTLLGTLEFASLAGEPPLTLGMVESYVPHGTTAWQFTVDWLDRYLEHVVTQPPDQRPRLEEDRSLWQLAAGNAPPEARRFLSGYLESATLLGQRTGELHLALAGSVQPDFVPEPFTQLYQRSLEQSTRKLTAEALQSLRMRLRTLPSDAIEAAGLVLAHESQIHAAFHNLLKPRIASQRIRCHGDFHLGRVLHTGKDFILVDFAGDVASETAARRIKRSPLLDVAGMIRSFAYVAEHVVIRLAQTGLSTPESIAAPQAALEFWYRWSSSAFLKAYAATLEPAQLLPEASAQRESLLTFHLLQAPLHELLHELTHRPQWSLVPLKAILALTQDRPPPA